MYQAIISEFKSVSRSTLRHFGYDIRRTSTRRDAFEDMRGLCRNPAPTIFDVGANVGQTTARFRNAFAGASIHAFEPGDKAYAQLDGRFRADARIRLSNLALGAERQARLFHENSCSDMSSFLEQGTAGWGDIESKTTKTIGTIDDYCREQHIAAIDILKSDTQGFDLEVLKGAEGLMQASRIHLVYLEITFSDMYKGLPRFDEICKFLLDRTFVLVSFYEIYYQNGVAGWTDALFVNTAFAPAASTQTL